MIKIEYNEYKKILAEGKHYNLSVASYSKKSRGKTHYVNNDDLPALSIVAKIRKTTVKELLKNN
jgi:hypothetical protein